MADDSTNAVFPLCGKDSGFSTGNALACAMASQACYLAPEMIPGIVLDQWKFSDYRRLQSEHIQGFIATSEHYTLLAFRGSEADVTNWQENLDTGFVPGPFRSHGLDGKEQGA